MGRLFAIFAIGAMLNLMNPGDLLAAPTDVAVTINKCKTSNIRKSCDVVSAPEINVVGGLVPIVLIGGTLLLAAESRRRRR